MTSAISLPFLADCVVGQEPDLYAAILNSAFGSCIVGDRAAHPESDHVHAMQGDVVAIGEVAPHDFGSRLAQAVVELGVPLGRSESLDLQEEPIPILDLACQLVEGRHGLGK